MQRMALPSTPGRAALLPSAAGLPALEDGDAPKKDDQKDDQKAAAAKHKAKAKPKAKKEKPAVS